MSEVNNAIVAQTCAKIASDLIISLEYRPETVEEVLEDFDVAFDHVYNKINSKYETRSTPSRGGRRVPIISRDEMALKLDSIKLENRAPESGSKPTVNMMESGPFVKNAEANISMKMPSLKPNLFRNDV